MNYKCYSSLKPGGRYPNCKNMGIGLSLAGTCFCSHGDAFSTPHILCSYWQMKNTACASEVITGFGEDSLHWFNCMHSWRLSSEDCWLVVQVFASHINSLPVINVTSFALVKCTISHRWGALLFVYLGSEGLILCEQHDFSEKYSVVVTHLALNWWPWSPSYGHV